MPRQARPWEDLVLLPRRRQRQQALALIIVRGPLGHRSALPGVDHLDQWWEPMRRVGEMKATRGTKSVALLRRGKGRKWINRSNGGMDGLAYDYIIDMMHAGLRATRSLLVLGAGASGGRVGLSSEAIAMCASIIASVSNFLVRY
jgi:hypothetical protein